MGNTDGIIFVLDSSDRDRIGDAREELHKMCQEDRLQEACPLIFANKQDLPNAMNSREIISGLGLNGIKDQQWYVQTCRATDGTGLYEGIDWLSRELNKK